MAFTLYRELKYALDGIPDSNLTAFPKLFIISGDSDIAAECSGGGGFKVTSADGSTDLEFEVVDSLTDLTSGDVAFFVSRSLLTGASVGDVICRIYYDGAETTDEIDPTAVWNSDFEAVYHLEEDPSGGAPQLIDSTANGYDLTTSGSMTSGDLVAAGVGNGIDFDGTDDYAQVTSGVVSGTPCTLECIVKPANTNTSRCVTLGVGTNVRTISIFLQDSGSGLKAWAQEYNGISGVATGTTTVPTNAFTHIAAVFDSDSSRSIFTNGGDKQTNSTNVTGGIGTIDRLKISGNTWTGDQLLAGIVDMVRVSNVARSDDWIAYTTQDLLNNADTFTLGTEQGGGGGATTFIKSYPRGIFLGMQKGFGLVKV